MKITLSAEQMQRILKLLVPEAVEIIKRQKAREKGVTA